MAYLTEDEVRARAATVTRAPKKSAHVVLTEHAASSSDEFDVFLSHSSAEPEEILLGIKAMLEEGGMSVYVDRYSDPQLNPDVVTAETADLLRRRMRQAESLLYVHSPHSTKSRWMPWELGFFDGLKGRVGVIPVVGGGEGAFKGEECLGLYPYVDIAADTADRRLFWINRSPSLYAPLYGWVRRTAVIEKDS